MTKPWYNQYLFNMRILSEMDPKAVIVTTCKANNSSEWLKTKRPNRQPVMVHLFLIVTKNCDCHFESSYNMFKEYSLQKKPNVPINMACSNTNGQNG